jgi:hypothetical protein
MRSTQQATMQMPTWRRWRARGPTKSKTNKKGNTENGEKQQHPVAGTHANETNNTRIYKQIVYKRAVVQTGK